MRDSRNTLILTLCTLFVLGTTAGCMMPVDADADADGDLGKSSEALSACQPQIPAALAVPAGHRLAFSYDAEGYQIYRCNGTAWTFVAPEADLFNARGRFKGTHYAGPTWEALDGSKVVAARVAGETVDATAIPWLLLGASTHEGNGRMARVSYIQRIDTTGGLAPTTGCDAEHVGLERAIDYTAIYNFYAPVPGHNP
jgi:hypothetical protein